MGVDWKHTYYHVGCFLDCFNLQMVQSPMVVACLDVVVCSWLRHILLHWALGPDCCWVAFFGQCITQ